MLTNTVKKKIADFIEKNTDYSCQFWSDSQYEVAAKVLREYNPEVLVEPKQQQQVSTIDNNALELEKLIAQARSQPASVYVGTLPQFKKIPSIV